jgi:aspartokinase/homoserine dehydrogenase 1
VTGKNVVWLLKNHSCTNPECHSRGDFGVAKKINIAFGHGLVGGTLINQILESAAAIEKKRY